MDFSRRFRWHLKLFCMHLYHNLFLLSNLPLSVVMMSLYWHICLMSSGLFMLNMFGICDERMDTVFADAADVRRLWRLALEWSWRSNVHSIYTCFRVHLKNPPLLKSYWILLPDVYVYFNSILSRCLSRLTDVSMFKMVVNVCSTKVYYKILLYYTTNRSHCRRRSIVLHSQILQKCILLSSVFVYVYGIITSRSCGFWWVCGIQFRLLLQLTPSHHHRNLSHHFRCKVICLFLCVCVNYHRKDQLLLCCALLHLCI